MTVQVEWFNAEKTVIYYVFAPMWTTDDYFAAVRRSHELRASVPHKVALLYDMRAAGDHFPFDIVKRYKELNQINTRAEQAPLMVVVGINPLFESLARIYFCIYRTRQKAVVAHHWLDGINLLREAGYLPGAAGQPAPLEEIDHESER